MLTNTAMFLIKQGLDLRLVRVRLYRMEKTLALTASQLLPVPIPRTSWSVPVGGRNGPLDEDRPRLDGRRSPRGSSQPGCSPTGTHCALSCPPALAKIARRSRPGWLKIQHGVTCSGGKTPALLSSGRSTTRRTT